MKNKSENKKEKDLTGENKSPNTDPLGSYTGKPQNEKEQPVQDADDL